MPDETADRWRDESAVCVRECGRTFNAQKTEMQKKQNDAPRWVGSNRSAQTAPERTSGALAQQPARKRVTSMAARPAESIAPPSWKAVQPIIDRMKKGRRPYISESGPHAIGPL